MKFRICFFFISLLLLAGTFLYGQRVPLWGKYEKAFTGRVQYEHPFSDAELVAEFRAPDGSVKKTIGFYDGGNRWKIRFMPDQAGKWTYRAWFTDRPNRKFRGRFLCDPSDIPGMITADETNPAWFGFKGGRHLLMRSFQVGDRFFAANFPDSARNRFLDWAVENRYNTLSVASHYLNRNQKDRGSGWSTPDLWDTLRRQPNPAAYDQMELILDNLAMRKIIVFPFGGFFGQGSNYPRDSVQQRMYVKYTIARLGAYWNLLYNVAGPEPTLPHVKQFTKAQVDQLGHLVASLNINNHLLTVHNEPRKNPFLASPWITFHCLQGASLNTDTLYHEIMRGRNPQQPVMAQEMLWYGNMYQVKDISDDQLRHNAYVINMAAAALNFGDNKGNSSTGFTGTLHLKDVNQEKHDIIKKVWDFFESIPFFELKPSPAVSDQGYTLSKRGEIYLTYLPAGGQVTINTENTGLYQGEWISGKDTQQRIFIGTTDGKNLKAPSSEDWLLYLRKMPGR